MGQIHPWTQNGYLPQASAGIASPHSKAELGRWTRRAEELGNDLAHSPSVMNRWAVEDVQTHV